MILFSDLLPQLWDKWKLVFKRSRILYHVFGMCRNTDECETFLFSFDKMYNKDTFPILKFINI